MTSYDDLRFEDEESALLDERPPRGHPIAAWIVIVAVTAFVVFMQQLRGEAQNEKKDAKGGYDPVTFQGRYLVGAAELGLGQKKDLVPQARQLAFGPWTQRLKAVVVVGELDGPREALDLLAQQRRADVPDPTEDEARLIDLLERQYEYLEHRKPADPPALDEDERTFVEDRLGWFGRLALTPAKGSKADERDEVLASARNLTIGVFAGVAGGCGGLVLGFALMVVVVVLLCTARPGRRAFRTGGGHHGIYAETFALWMVVFLGVLFSGSFLPETDSRLFHSSLLALATLLVLAWPVLRGVPWKQVRKDVGLHVAGKPIRQVLCGPMCWLATWPLAAVAMIVTLVLLTVFAPPQQAGGGGPAHPIVGLLGDADGWMLFQIFFAACVQAPIVEEVFFRGVLYRHLREASAGMHLLMSVIVSALLNAFVFAVVHPQGIFGVPMLMSLAIGFSIAREWRGSLVPCIVGHGLNNGLVLLIVVNLLAG